MHLVEQTAAEETAETVTEQWVTRARAVQLSHLSESTLRRKEKEGALKPRHNEKGKVLYLVDELIQIRRSPAEPAQPTSDAPEPGYSASERGERAAEVFELLDQGKTGADIVKALRMEPAEVSMWQAQWAKMCGRGVWMSEAALLRLHRSELLSLASADSSNVLEECGDEDKLVRAVALAFDAAKGAYTPPPRSAADVARWLSARWHVGEVGTLTVNSSAIGVYGFSKVEQFKLQEWSSAEQLAEVAFTSIEKAMSENLRIAVGLDALGALHDGSYELVLATERGMQRMRVDAQSAAYRDLAAARTSRGLPPLLARLRQLVERAEDQHAESCKARDERAKDRHRERRENAKDEAQHRTRERKTARKQLEG